MKTASMSTRRIRRVRLTKGCAQKKRLVCSKCDDQSFDTFAHNLPSGPVKAESMSTCRIRRAGHYEGLCFCISSCGQKKGIFCSKCGSSSDKRGINEYMSDSKCRSLRRAVLLHQQLCPERKASLVEICRSKFAQICTSSASGSRQCVVKI